MIIRPVQVSFLAIIAVFLSSFAFAHPVPDIPVRTFFPGDGTARVTVEIDPRCFEPDPENAPSLLPHGFSGFTDAEKDGLKARAADLVRRSVEFTLKPLGKMQPEFTFTFTGKSGVPIGGADDPIVLTGEWKTQLASGLTGWKIRSLPGGKLSVIFQNIVRGTSQERIAVLFPGESSFTLELSTLTIGATAAAPDGERVSPNESGGSLSTFWQYLREGFRHVLPLGMDHILFVLGLFLLSRDWKPLLAQVTTFTLAHSITLALATIGIVKVSGSIVEPIIAASIAFVAIENIFRPRYTHWRLLVVFAFGLIHGLGFAGALEELELPTGSLIAGLVGFNVGVEGGQLAVVAIAFLATFWVREPKNYRRWVVIPGSIYIAARGVWWTIERVFGE
ncbi:MAG: hypothetical protein RL088_3109 [Verrucomicrobiota bacterium]|jgi:hypothetical protein